MPMDDRPTRYNHSCLLDLDDSHGRIGVGSIFSSPSPSILNNQTHYTYLNRIFLSSLRDYKLHLENICSIDTKCGCPTY